MSSHEIRRKFLKFFKARGHAIVPSSSLVPDDPSVLLTTAGMQQFKRYFTGELDPMKDFVSKNTVSIQKSFRTSDIDEVGDESHLTFFEMLGNFSFGGYWKEEAIKYAYEFITDKDWMNLKIDYVSVFGGDGEVPADTESEKIWKSLGVKDVRKSGREDNFWGPTGAEGPCGPTTEIYVNGVEIWNIVFNEYYCHGDKRLEKLKTPGVDTGMGLERLAMVSQGVSTIFETDLFAPILENLPSSFEDRQKRIIADHARGVVFLIADGVHPSNKEQGYVLRRLMRRMIAQQAFGSSGLLIEGLGQGIDMSKILEKIIEFYKDFYPNLKKDIILPAFEEEAKKYGLAIEKGIKEIAKMNEINADQAFYLFESFGLPYEAIKDIAGDKAKNLTREAFDIKFKQHQDLSRISSAGMFRGGLADSAEKTIRLHTTHHLLLKALQIVLGPQVKQRGSNITQERLRIDFLHDAKMTDEQKKEVERIVNEKIKEDLPVIRSEMPLEEAEKLHAEHEFGAKYPERVSVYSIGPRGATEADPQFKKAFSIEFCGGPHVKHTGEIGHFKVAKEEAVGAGVRRIRGTVDID